MAAHSPPLCLAELLLTLPQEIYDEIYDLTFTAPPGVREITYDSEEAVTSHYPSRHVCKASVITIDQGVRGQRRINQTLLSVSRATRVKYAASYYGGEGAIFAVAYAGAF